MTILVNRLQSASTAELTTIRADYEAYLATLTTDEQLPVICQINAVLRELVGQSTERLEEVASLYLTRTKDEISA